MRDMNVPFVSCLCPTFARFPDYGHLLGEAVESFRRQNYPPDRRELLILNDCPRQKLTCGVQGVRIVNMPQRLPTLGDKYNLMCELAYGSVLLPWEDDDISLPGRITQAAMSLDQGFGYFNPQRTWFLAATPAGPEGAGLHWQHSHVVCHNASAFTKEAWNAAGRYPSASGNQDAIMDQRLKSLGKTAPPLADDPAYWQYIYCWGRSNIHLSGNHDTARAYADWGRLLHASGRFEITPGWVTDYEKLCASAATAAQGVIIGA